MNPSLRLCELKMRKRELLRQFVTAERLGDKKASDRSYEELKKTSAMHFKVMKQLGI